MTLIYRYKMLETLNGENYRLPTQSYYLLEECKNRADQNLDNVIVITGGVGSGKSNLSKGINGTYQEHFFKRKYTLDNLYFLIDKVLEAFDKKNNKTQPINYDEAVQGGTGRDGLTKIGNQLRNKFITKRSKKHLITLCIDNPKELNDKIIERCVAWYHVFYYRDVRGKYHKGLFKVFSGSDLQTVYEDLKSYKYRFVHQHPIYKMNHKIYTSDDYSNLWYSEQEYEDKKDEETSSIEDKRNLLWAPLKMRAFHYWSKGLKHREIVDETGCTIDQIKVWSSRDFKSVVVKVTTI